MMHEPCYLTLDGIQYVLVVGEHSRWLAEGWELVSAWEARRALMRADPRLVVRGHLGVRSDDGVRLEVLIARRPGVVLLRRPPRTHGPLLVDLEAGDLVEPEPEPDSAAALRGDAWIEVQVVDGDDEPCANVDFEIELSDGRVRQGRTNEHGVLRYEEIVEGLCTIRLLDLDESEWRVA